MRVGWINKVDFRIYITYFAPSKYNHKTVLILALNMIRINYLSNSYLGIKLLKMLNPKKTIFFCIKQTQTISRFLAVL